MRFIPTPQHPLGVGKEFKRGFPNFGQGTFGPFLILSGYEKMKRHEEEGGCV